MFNGGAQSTVVLGSIIRKSYADTEGRLCKETGLVILYQFLVMEIDSRCKTSTHSSMAEPESA